jgi:RNA polymerase-interacting CarD/CdnL/TRCF family regulator
MRILGGSLGIAVSSIIRNLILKRELGLAPDQIATITSTARSNPTQWAMLQRAYSDWFNQTMRVSAIITAASVVTALFTFHRQRALIRDRQKQLFLEYRRILAEAKG